MIAAFGDTLKDDVFKEKVGVYSSREISRLAKERKAGSMGFAEAMLIAYNRKAKKGLSWAKLYYGKKDLPPDVEADMEYEEEEEHRQEVWEYK